MDQKPPESTPVSPDLFPLNREVVSSTLNRIAEEPYGAFHKEANRLVSEDPVMGQVIDSLTERFPRQDIVQSFYKGAIWTSVILRDQASHVGRELPKVTADQASSLVASFNERYSQGEAVDIDGDLKKLEEEDAAFADAVVQMGRFEFNRNPFQYGSLIVYTLRKRAEEAKRMGENLGFK